MKKFIHGYVFAGGQSSRMGQDKALLEFAGVTLAQLAVDKLALVAPEVHLCGWNSALPAPAPVLRDIIPDCGPLAPLVTALEHAATQNSVSVAVVLAVDIPLVPWQLLEWLAQRKQLNGAWASVPVVEGRPQPLCAVYSAQLAPSLRSQLISGERKLMRAIESACPPAKLDKFVLADILDAPRREALPVWFANVNTQGDLARAGQSQRHPHVW